jgi:uncharacterized protein YhaN
MKLLHLDLRAFGPFAHAELPLAEGAHGLHVIYGPNEAGKSSALRALWQLLFGIEERTPDQFLHPYDKLRIGGRLRHSDGSELEFVRRKGRKNTLSTYDEKTPLEGAPLARFLGRLDADRFKTMFALNRDMLERGGQEILRGGGEFGQSLFASGAGIADLHSVQKELVQDYEKLFLPAGKNPVINARLSEWRAEQDKTKNLQLSSDHWQQHERNLREAETQARQLNDRLEELSKTITRLTRMRDALPALTRRTELLTELEPYRAETRLSDDFRERRADAQEALRLAAGQLASAQDELSRIDRELAQLTVRQDLLNHADVIESLYQKKGAVDKASDDRRECLARQLDHERRAREIWKSLGRTEEMSLHVESLRLRPDEPALIRERGNESALLAEKLNRSRERIEGLQRQIAACQTELHSAPPPGDLTELKRLVGQIQSLGPLEDGLRQAEDRIRQLALESKQQRTRLRLQVDNDEAILLLPVPNLETVERFHQEFHKVEQRLELSRNNRETLAAELDRVLAELEQLDLQYDVPSEDDVKEARRRRDGIWGTVRQAWKDHVESIPLEPLAYYQTGDLTEAYERSVQQADGIADRLRHEADRVARKVELLVQQNRLQTQLQRAGEQIAELERDLDAIQRDWQHHWQAISPEPLTPNELRPLVDQFNALVALVQEMQKEQSQADAERDRIDALAEQLRTLLATPAAQSLSLADLIERAHVELTDKDQRARHLQQLRDEMARADKELAQELQDHDRLLQARSAWEADWTKILDRLGLAQDTTPASVNICLDEIARMWQELEEAASFRARIAGIDSEKDAFEKQVKELQERLLPGGNIEATRAIVELQQSLHQARTDQEKARGLHERRQRFQEQVLQEQTAMHVQRANLDALCTEAGAASAQELPILEDRSARRQVLERELQQKDVELLPLRAGESIDAFTRAAAQLDADQIDLDLARLTQEKSALHEQLTIVNQTIGKETTELAHMDGGAAAAETAQRAEALAAELRDRTREYVVLRLAAGVLRKGIEQYRQKNQGPILERASALFRLLTNGSFAALELDQAEDGAAMLAGVRGKDRSLVAPPAMSDGTRDQLYLALRLASVEVFLQNHEPIPFIVDDLLLNFDDDRAAAALQALADLSRRTQVLFFTHHQHLVELARQQLPGDVLFVHTLAS